MVSLLATWPALASPLGVKGCPLCGPLGINGHLFFVWVAGGYRQMLCGMNIERHQFEIHHRTPLKHFHTKSSCRRRYCRRLSRRTCRRRSCRRRCLVVVGVIVVVAVVGVGVVFFVFVVVVVAGCFVVVASVIAVVVVVVVVVAPSSSSLSLSSGSALESSASATLFPVLDCMAEK